MFERNWEATQNEYQPGIKGFASKECANILVAMGFPRTENTTPGENVFVIAEIGKNFIQTEADQPVERYIENAKTLIDAAADAGADAAKFQTHTVEDEQLDTHIVSPHFQASDRYSWVKRNTEATPERFWREVQDHCHHRGILFCTTPMSRGALRKIIPLNPPFWKVSSADVQDHILLHAMLETRKPVIISTGMVSLIELDRVVATIGKQCPQLGVLYCVSQYPCPQEQFNLASITRFIHTYPDAVIGFSDHSIGPEASLAAVKLGARIIEKHFSLSRDLWGSDHKVSMTPAEMRSMVDAIRNRSFQDVNASPFLGDLNRELEGATNAYRPYFGKMLVAGRDLSAGSVLTEDAIYAMRPAMGASGMRSDALQKVLGKRIAKALHKYDPIASNILQ